MNTSAPKERGLDHTLAIMQEGYLFIQNRLDYFQSNIVETRLFGQKVICMSGAEAARIFYDSEKFKRQGAAPKRVQKTLFGVGAIQSMDGQVHRHRKVLFNALMTPTHQKQIAELTLHKWRQFLSERTNGGKVILFEEARKVLCEAACEWAGVPLKQKELPMRAKDFTDMVYAFGTVGPIHWRGRKARKRAEAWIKDIIRDVRKGRLQVPKESATHQMAFHQQLNGNPFDLNMAAIELINVLRPIVAISTFITFAALALYEHPHYIEKLRHGSEKDLENFSQEVRRYYPFAPFVGARVNRPFIWNDCKFSKGMLVLLDLYGTNHDTNLWEQPKKFYPERFDHMPKNAYHFMPQGGGDVEKGHRCPGEGITVEVIKASLSFLLHDIKYDIPKQDLRYKLNEIPTLPTSGFVMKLQKNEKL
ncbi:cytochrome P450 [Gracilibacillus sp. YIM 98692]|uniref:cytochrome P450 n=1 Tax=Gracilibacillus sp. YIM 98692 TaxID=2663532 RepID=UPI0013D80CFD|nr:cytochrome P450 [Gracilibacillus sp. YIM 98692]